MSKKVLRETFLEAFDFLWNEFGFVVINDTEDNWGYLLEAKTEIAGIRIEYEYREASVLVTLYKLINGKIVENTAQAILNNWEINGFSLDWILALRNPEAQTKPAYEYGVDSVFYEKDNGLKNYIRVVADRLKEYASDILQGDFSVFGILDAMVRDYYKNYYNKRK